MNYSTVKRINITEVLSERLAFRISCDVLFDKIEKMNAQEFIIDFSNVRTISRSFAHQYIMRKNASKKIIREDNIPTNIRKMLEIVEKQLDKPRMISKRPNFKVITV